MQHRVEDRDEKAPPSNPEDGAPNFLFRFRVRATRPDSLK